MARYTEVCLNCHQTFYQQSLNPLKLEDFHFAGSRSPSLACFVESNFNIPGSPKVCNTCLILIKDSHIASKRIFQDNGNHKLPAYVCATCNHLSPAHNLMNMRLTVVRLDGRQINLEECARVCLKNTIRTDVNLMICLACLSVIVEEYQQRANEAENKSAIDHFGGANRFMGAEIKQEPTEAVEGEETTYVFQSLPPMFASSCTTIIKTEFQDQFEETEKKPALTQKMLKDHICPICHEDFPNYSSRERHRRKVHGKAKKVTKNRAIFSCAHCPSTFGSRSWMLIHMSSHRSDHEMRKFECHHCPKWYRTKRQIREHLEIKHFPKKEVTRKMPDFHTCGICSGVFYDRHEYQTHMKSHEELDNLECAGCKKKFKSTFVYIRHVQTQKELHTCTKCDGAFHSKGRLDKHLRLQHNESYVCEICNLPLYTRRTFEVHQQVRHGISIESRCKHCGKTYESREKLKEHVKAEHPDTREKPLVCEQCGKAFPTDHDLKLHLESHSDKLECPLCRKKLKNSDTLANHMKNIHSGRKTDKTEYPCPKCPLLFERRQYLEGHMIVHNTDNRPFFQCTRCGIAYTRRQKLQAHVSKCPKKDLLY